MLDEDTHVTDCQLLGIDADSGLVEVERVWRNLKAVYAEDSLATYGLYQDGGRQEYLEQLEGVYGRIVRRLSQPAAEQSVTPAGGPEAYLPQFSPVEFTGGYLRQRRESAGLTLREVAHRTKIGSTRLDQIEKEMFDRLPAAVYLRGFVLEYAKALGIAQPQEVVAVYLARYHERVDNP
jgi:flagellar biosynthesis protein FlhG